MPASFFGHPFNLQGLLDNGWHVSRPDFWIYDNSMYSGAGKTLTYSYSTNATSSFRAIYDAAFAELQSYLAVDFNQTADEAPLSDDAHEFAAQPLSDSSADLRLSQQTSGARGGGFGFLGKWDVSGDRDVDDIDSFVQVWDANYYTMLHELGHALGLKHTSPGQSPDQAPYIEAQYRNANYTVMHYVLEEDGITNEWNPAQGDWDYRHFQLLDVYALQVRYGANTTTFSGDTNHTVLGLGVDQWLKVLWDAGGNDTIDMGNQTVAQTIDLREGRFSILGSVVGNNPDHFNLAIAFNAKIENATGGSAADTIYGNSLNNVINGGDGNDILYLWTNVGVAGGNDTVNGGNGSDNIFFGATLNSSDVVNGGAGVDTLVVQGPYGSLTLTANITQIENLSILGGNNVSFGEPGTNLYDYVLTTHDANFAAGVQARINGAALLAGEDFTFDGSAETDASYVVYGGKGKDTLLGGLGNDIFFYAEERFATGDTVNGGPGYDGMFLRGNYTIDFNAPGYTGLFTNIENLTLTSATDERYARGGGTEFDYNLVLSNAIVGAGATLTISGTLLMATETMILDGSQESNGLLRLFAGAAADTLKGGGQADLLHGNLGADTLTGGAGADSFRYQSTAESTTGSMDQILDFTPGTDKIELDKIDSNSLVAGDQAFAWIGSSAFSGAAGQLRAVQSGGNWLLQGDTNGDGVADLVVSLTLQGATPLGAADFIL